jgi:hypothetical protein
VAAGVCAAALLAAGLTVAVSGDASGKGDALREGAGGTPGARPTGLRAHLQEFRARSADRYALLVLTNRGTETVVVEDLRLETPDLRRVAPEAVDAEVAPGTRVDVPVRYGEARCEERGTANAGRGATAWVRVRVGDGAPQVARLALPDPEPYVRRVVSLDCQRHALDEAADVRLAPDLVRTGPTRWRTRVVVQRRGSQAPVSPAPVDVLSLTGSVVYTVTPHPDADARQAGVVVRLAAGERRAAAPVTLALPSCAPHLLTEAKKALVFPMRARVGGGADLTTTLRVPPSTSRRVLALLAATCGGGAHVAPGSP